MQNDTTRPASPYIGGDPNPLRRYAAFATSTADQYRAVARELARVVELAADLTARAEENTDSGDGEWFGRVMPADRPRLACGVQQAVHAAMDQAIALAAALELDAIKADVHRDHFADRSARKGRTSKRATAKHRASKQTPAPVLSPAA